MMRKLLVAAALALTGACSTFGGGKSKMIELTTEPPGATATVEGFGECETPCRIEIDAPRMVHVAKAGFVAQRFQIVPDKRKVNVVMELSAPTSDVDTTALPEIE